MTTTKQQAEKRRTKQRAQRSHGHSVPDLTVVSVARLLEIADEHDARSARLLVDWETYGSGLCGDPLVSLWVDRNTETAERLRWVADDPVARQWSAANLGYYVEG